MGETRVLWAEHTAEQLRAKAKDDAIVIVPVASLEQHGPHLPTGTDTMLGEEAAKRTAIMASATHPTIVTPAIWTGLSEHHMKLGGTVTLDFAGLFGVIRGVVTSLKRQGFRRVLLLNSHGGNVAALRTITEELTRDLEMPIATTTYWRVAQEEIASVLETQDGIRHACEGETSLMMVIRPDLVDHSRFAEAKDMSRVSGPARPDETYRWVSFADTTKIGVMGDPTVATIDKGERLFDTTARHLASAITSDAFWGL